MKLKTKIISGVLAAAMMFGLLTAVPTEVKAETLAEAATESISINEFDTITIGEQAVIYKVTIKQKGSLSLNFKPNKIAARYEWYNEEGKLLSSETSGLARSSLDFKDLEAGIYYLRIWASSTAAYGDYTYYGSFTPDESASLELGISLVKGKSVQLAAMFENCTDKTLTWKSSNKKIATVNKNGKVTAKKKGTVTIKAYNESGLIAKIKVKVTNK
jgi:hypothetical protein